MWVLLGFVTLLTVGVTVAAVGVADRDYENDHHFD